MAMQQLLTACRGIEGALECTPFGPLPICFKAGPRNRIFAQLNTDKVTFRCTRLMGEVWRAQHPETVTRGYHCPPVQAPYFVTVWHYEAPDELLTEMLRHAHGCALTGAK